MNKSSQIKVRVAPSPTGAFHVGNAQSALFNWLFARKNGGEFYLRIEDTDVERSTKESERGIMEALAWLDLNPDPLKAELRLGIRDGIIHQSQRKSRYHGELERLISSGKAFWCNHTKEELEAEKKRQESQKEPPRHLCNHKHRHHKTVFPATSPENKDWIIRLNVEHESDRKIIFNDVIRGPIEFEARLLGDISIARSLDSPLYNFAVVVDDSDMEISYVIRGEDHISNTPKQILIYEALELSIPMFAHLPLILGPDKSKLSKRHGGTSTADYQKDYLPAALLNFLGGLSYTFSKEIISKEEMVQEFDLAKVHKSGAVFDIKKLNWLNSQYVKMLTPDELRTATGISQIPDAAVPLITERLEKLSEAGEYGYLWEEPEYDVSLLLWKTSSFESVKKALDEVKVIVAGYDFKNGKEKFRKALDSLGEKTGDRGLVYWPLRVALSGKQKSPDPVDIAFVIGKEKTLERIDTALKK